MKHVILATALLLQASFAAAQEPVTQAVNALRADKNRTALTYSATLEAAARDHAADMAQKGFFSHQGSDGSQVSDRVSAQGYRWCFVAENIAKGQRSLDEVMQGWEQSRGHYENMISADAREIGLARGTDNIWVMVLAAPC